MATKPKNTPAGSIDIAALLAKRDEELGIGDALEVVIGKTTIHVPHPAYRGAEWNDRMAQLNQDSEDGLLTNAEYRDEFLELLFGDKTEAFVAAVAEVTTTDPMTVAQLVLSEEAERQAKNRRRRNSRGGRKR